MKTAAAIGKILKTEGTEYLFCFPLNALIDECARLGIRPIVARTERTLLNMADGYSRAANARHIGVAAVQHGPGAENAFAGVAQAYADGSPVLFLPGGNPAPRVEIPPNFDAPESYRTVAKWSARVNSPQRVAALFRRAFTLLRSGRPGPVLVEVPVDIAGAETDPFDYQPTPPLRSSADPLAVRGAVQTLREARRPLLHAGQGVLWAEAWDELREFAELLQAPVMTTLPGKSAFPENHPLSVGTGGYSGTAMAGHFLQQADVVFGIGCSFTSTLFGAPIPLGKVILHTTNTEADINKDVAARVPLLGDAKLVLRHDSGTPRDQLVPFWETLTPRGFLGWGKSTQLGSSLGFAVNNGMMGNYDKHIPFASERYRSRFLSGDYVKVAEGLGVAVERVTQPQDIVPALRRAIGVVGYGPESVAGGGRPALVEFITREETRLSKPW